MKLYIAVTDNDWFRFHFERSPDEVNFWRPGGGTGSIRLEEGAPFLFKLHSPENFIAGGGFFLRYSRLPLSMAWKLFEQKNGSADFEEFRRTILKKRKEDDRPGIDPVIGCIILAVPFFFARDMWLPAPADWHPSIEQGKGYDTTSGIGKGIWDEVIARLGQLPSFTEIESEIRKKGPLYVVEGRQGQGGFRTNVLEAYHRRCSITLERTMPALEASHIKPYKLSGPNKVSNGILLRADLHQIFDEGYITITTDYTIRVSPRIRQEYENGREYYRYDRQKLANLPESDLNCPQQSYIAWHNEHVYRG